MDDIGASEDVRKVRMESSVTREILRTVFFQPENSVYYFGSQADGTTTLGMKSDFDTVYIFNKLPVVTDPSEHPVGTSLLFIQDTTIPAGYCKLQLTQDGVPQYGDVPDADPYPDERCRRWLQFIADTDNRLICCFTPNYSDMRGFYQRHGPAMTRNASAVKVSLDIVVAVECYNTSHFIHNWLSRTRKFDWPSGDILQICKTAGCLFVPVGHPHSEDHEQQWRISLSRQEKLLVTQFNSVQFKCFILLKMISKKIIHKFVADSLSSYHIKTCMFFLIENTPCEFWKPENLLVCISLCLRKLLEWVDAGYCPNYFIPEENMFDRRIHGTVRLRLQGVLQQLVSADCKFLSGIQCDGVGERFIRYFLTPCITTGDDDGSDNISTLIKLREVCHVCVDTFYVGILHSTLFCKRDIATTLNQTLKSISVLRNTTTITRHTIEETQKAKSLILPYLELSLMSNSVAYAVDQNKPARDIWHLLTSIRWKEMCMSSDSLSARLKQASMLYMMGYYQTSLDVLSSLTGLVRHTYCRCYLDKDIVVSPGGASLLEITRDISDVTPEYLLKNVIVPCVYFLPTEKRVTPAALCYEMERMRGPRPESDNDLCNHDRRCGDWAFVDGNFLLHFLLYLNHNELNRTQQVKTDTRNMRKLLSRNNEKHLSHRETCLNLLGWVNKEQGNTETAQSCFRTSLKVKSLCNAAFQHMTTFSVSITESHPERTMTAEGHAKQYISRQRWQSQIPSSLAAKRQDQLQEIPPTCSNIPIEIHDVQLESMERQSQRQGSCCLIV